MLLDQLGDANALDNVRADANQFPDLFVRHVAVEALLVLRILLTAFGRIAKRDCQASANCTRSIPRNQRNPQLGHFSFLRSKSKYSFISTRNLRYYRRLFARETTNPRAEFGAFLPVALAIAQQEG